MTARARRAAGTGAQIRPWALCTVCRRYGVPWGVCSDCGAGERTRDQYRATYPVGLS